MANTSLECFRQTLLWPSRAPRTNQFLRSCDFRGVSLSLRRARWKHHGPLALFHVKPCRAPGLVGWTILVDVVNTLFSFSRNRQCGDESKGLASDRRGDEDCYVFHVKHLFPWGSGGVNYSGQTKALPPSDWIELHTCYSETPPVLSAIGWRLHLRLPTSGRTVISELLAQKMCLPYVEDSSER